MSRLLDLYPRPWRDRYGEEFRALCEIKEPLLVSTQTTRCLTNARVCEEAPLEACGLESISIVCREDRDCPGPFLCDEKREECVRCFHDSDCPPGRGCISDLCYDKDAPYFRPLADLFDDEDAGSPAD